MNFPEASIFSSNKYKLSRKPYQISRGEYAIEQAFQQVSMAAFVDIMNFMNFEMKVHLSYIFFFPLHTIGPGSGSGLKHHVK